MENTTLKNIIIETLAFLGLTLSLVYAIKYYPALPSKIPNHYTSSGLIEDYMSKNIIIIMTCLNIGMYLLLTLLKKHPNWCNSPVEVTEKNKKELYTIDLWFVSLLKLNIVWIFTFSILSIINNALENKSALQPIIIMLIITFIVIAVFVIKMTNTAKPTLPK
ncbi:DUF1648 domain-containing protein [Clostridium ganghwense]|uniref:DUF1648 domain-containing protein n=1 Tax=Clostridium ganghwense TaxID=312089 RepID=A0ABT4CQR6_9CLOT|nr:DUF1648 domain-containing protein [Clostridium ganghwense]MCY6371404.1 DUF1648 domain-containing protein [Clostridium ganghwense]